MTRRTLLFLAESGADFRPMVALKGYEIPDPLLTDIPLVDAGAATRSDVGGGDGVRRARPQAACNVR
jgi:hypothetical protein